MQRSDSNVIIHPPQAGANAADRRTAKEAIEGKIHINGISWYVPYFNPKIDLMFELDHQQNFHTIKELFVLQTYSLETNGLSI